jgi:hypothetical protein
LLWESYITNFTVVEATPDPPVDQGWFFPYEPNAYWNHPDHQRYFLYNCEDIEDPFIQVEGTVYWLFICAMTDLDAWGWKTADVDQYPPPYTGLHYMDNAVYLYEYPDTWRPLYDPRPEYGQSLDLAFVIDGTPEIWIPGDDVKMHWPQIPDEEGYDIHACDSIVLADDWECIETNWVKDIHWWGSWMSDDIGMIEKFKLAIYSDVPDPDGTGPLYSMPGELLWEYEVSACPLYEHPLLAPTVSEWWWCPYHDVCLPMDHQQYFQYDLNLPPRYWFWQEEGTIYWLSITAVVDTLTPFTSWGWKTTYDYLQFNDDAVWKLESWPDTAWVELWDCDYLFSLDLAFAITNNDEEFGTDIQLNSLDARIVDGLVEIHWSTANEIGNAGFNVYRASSKDGVQEKINDELIPARGDEVRGAAYSFIDKNAGGYYWLEDVDLSGVAGARHGPVLASGGDVPAAFSLAQNHPNPFNPNTRIMYNLASDCHVKLDIYNVVGQKVTTLVDEHQRAGSRTVEWNGRDASGANVASGIYFYRITAGSFVDIKKMVLLR